MRLQNDVLARYRTPAAGMTFTGLDEINRTLIFRTPAPFKDLITRFVYLDETAWKENGIHGQILAADLPIGVVNL